LNELFTTMALPKLRELAERISSISENLEKIGKEIEGLTPDSQTIGEKSS